MWVSEIISLVFWCAFGSVVGGGLIIQKRDVSELIGKSEQVRTSSRLSNRYLPPQFNAEPQHTHQLTAPVDISSKLGDVEPAFATSDIENLHYENHSQISINGISPTNPLKTDFSSDISANGVHSPSTELKSSEVSAPQYDSKSQISQNGISQTKSGYETQDQISVNGQVTGRFRENGNGLALQNTAELSNRNFQPSLNYLPPQSQTLAKPIRLLDKLGDIGTSYISSTNGKVSDQLFTNSPESPSGSSTDVISNEQQLPSRFSEPNSFSSSSKAFKTYGPPSLQQQRSGYTAQDFNGNVAQNVESIRPAPTEQTKIAGAQEFNIRTALQNGVGQDSRISSGTDVAFLEANPQFSQQKTQFGYEAQSNGNVNDFKSDNNYRYSQSRSNIGAVSDYQQNNRASSLLISPSTSPARPSENHLQPFRSTFSESRYASVPSGNGYRYENPDLGIAVEASRNLQTSNYQRGSDFAGITSRQNFQLGGTPDLENTRLSSTADATIINGAAYKYVRPAIGLGPQANLRAQNQLLGVNEIAQRVSAYDQPSITGNGGNFEVNKGASLRLGSDSSPSFSNDGAYKYVRPFNGIRAQTLEVRLQPQTQPFGTSEVSQRVSAYDQAPINEGNFGVEEDENLKNARLSSGSDSAYSGGAAYTYVRPSIGLGTQTLEARIQPEIPLNQVLTQRISTYTQASNGGNGEHFGVEKHEDFSGQQTGGGQNYDSSGGYVY